MNLNNEKSKTEENIDNSKTKKVKCKCCNEYFTASEKKKHIQSQAQNGKPFKCTLCKKSFKRDGFLKLHIQHCHNDERPHKCTKCHKSFTLIGNLEQHLLVHEKRYKCPICKQLFTRSYNLKMHSLIHSDEMSPV